MGREPDRSPYTHLVGHGSTRLGPPDGGFEWREMPREGDEVYEYYDVDPPEEGELLLVPVKKNPPWAYCPAEGPEEAEKILLGFSEIGRLSDPKAAVLNFANEFGPLGTYLFPLRGETRRYQPEKMSDWISHATELTAALQLASFARSGKPLAIRRGLNVRAGSATLFLGDGAYVREIEDPKIREGRLREAAPLFIQEITNRKLQNWVSPALQLGNGTSRALLLGQHSPSLAGMIWLQFARAIAQGRVKCCAECSELLISGDKTSRIDREYCSQACKQREYRARVKKKKAAKHVSK